MRQLASELGGHPNRARAHLDALEADGLIETGSAPAVGRGRPATCYRIRFAGRRVLDGDAGADYQGLAAALARHLTATGDTSAARRIGVTWARELAVPKFTPGTDQVDQVVQVLRTLGFAPEPDDTWPDHADLLLRRCPFVAEARTQPGVICGVHHGLIEGVLAEAGCPATIQLLPFSDPGACRVRVLVPGSVDGGQVSPAPPGRC